VQNGNGPPAKKITTRGKVEGFFQTFKKQVPNWRGGGGGAELQTVFQEKSSALTATKEKVGAN